ncbi:DUF4251 domain-containing protein [Psychroflexus tropicus]|uniref:DUF4251 domain-containing protein n=1 Tax=Psychroflexus tropicus TaxID=197345 RepID=UPI00037E59AB|nr:DUF4251 domain-containing protein [Psychroflexus tropicus]
MNIRSLFSLVLTLLVSSSVLISCGTSKIASDEEIKQLDQLVEERQFEFDLQFARPLVTNSLNQLDNAGFFMPGDNASRINLSGFSTRFEFKGDSVVANLPYFGERQMGGGFNSDTGINFEGIAKDLNLVKKESQYQLKFNIKGEGVETYRVTVTLFPGFSGTININSAQRFPIRYDGNISMNTED